METSTSAAMKIKCPKDISIPYILNGELYEIITQDGENVTVRCCNCPSDRVYRGSVRSTGNFHMHIKRRHPTLLGKLHEMKVESLLVRREKLLRAKKLAIRGRIKKEDSICGDGVVDSARTRSQSDKPSVDFSQRAESEDFNERPSQEMDPPTINCDREPNIIITTEVHCDRDANMGVLAPPTYFSTIKEETALADDQAIDLSTSSKRSDNSLDIPVSNLRWEQVLQRVENSLKDIQREMRTRNQIETNRIFLDLAKFKYLNPGFHYQS